MKIIDKLLKTIENNQRKQKVNSIKGVAVLAVLGVAIGGATVAILTKCCCSKIKQIIIKKGNEYNEYNDIDEDIDNDIFDDINEETNIKRDEIKKSVETAASDKHIGNVGIAMEDAIDDLEEENQNVENDLE
jgi:hypothetical protein